VLQRDDHDWPLTMLGHVVLEIREAQVPLLSAMLLGGCTAKLARVLRVGSLDAGLGPTALFPLRLRRPVAMVTCAVELGCAIGLIVTAGRLGQGEVATAVRLATSLMFLVATCALIELRTSRPGEGCGCFGDLSTSPVSGRTLTRSAFFAVAALATIGLPPLQAPHPSVDAARLLGIFAVEFLVIAALSPEVGEALVRLGYSEPCELRRLPAVRTLAALRRSAQWRRRAGLITAEMPVDMWRELCWRYVVFPARLGESDAEIVFAVYLRPHRPVIHAALVDTETGDVLAWPVTPAPRVPRWLLVAGEVLGFGRPFRPRRASPGHLDRPGGRAGPAGPAVPGALGGPGGLGRLGRPSGLGGLGGPRTGNRRPGPGGVRVPAGLLAAPTDPGRGIPAIRAESPPHPRPGLSEPGPSRAGQAGAGPSGAGQAGAAEPIAPRTPPDDLPFSSDL
jgi:hypothetical protein